MEWLNNIEWMNVLFFSPEAVLFLKRKKIQIKKNFTVGGSCSCLTEHV